MKRYLFSLILILFIGLMACKDKIYVVSFDSNGGSEIANVEVAKNDKVLKPTNPVNQGFRFVCWELSGVTFNFEEYQVKKNITLKAIWSSKAIVTFDTGLGSSIAPIEINVGSKIDKPVDPILGENRFMGWKYDGDDFDFNIVITDNITLIAMWSTQVYITYDTNGGSFIQPQLLYYGDLVPKPANPTKDNVILSHWVLDGVVFNFETYQVSVNITLVAIWTDMAILSFDSMGGSSVSNRSIKIGTYGTNPSIPVKEGYLFDGWLYNGEKFDIRANIIYNHMHFEANWIYGWDLYYEDYNEVFKDYDETRIYDVNYINFTILAKNGSTFNYSTTSPDAYFSGSCLIVLRDILGGNEKRVIVNVVGSLLDAKIREEFSFEIIFSPIQELEVTSSKEVLFQNLTPEYAIASTSVRMYYMNNSIVPYIDIKDFLEMLEGFLFASIISYTFDEINNILILEYVYEEYDEVTSELYSFDLLMEIDFNKNTIYVNEYDFFGALTYETETEYSKGLYYIDSYSQDKDPSVVFELSKYRFDCVVYEDNDEYKFLLPFVILNQLFCGSNYYNIYYTESNLYGVYFSVADSTDPGTKNIRDNGLTQNQQTGDLRIASLDSFAFALDYLYGLKKTNGVISYYDKFNSSFYRAVLSLNTTTNTNAYAEFVYMTIDEMHSSFSTPSIYANPNDRYNLTSVNQLGKRQNGWYSEFFYFQTTISNKAKTFSDGKIPLVRYYSDTAIIYLDGFYTATVGDVLGVDSDLIMKQIMAEIVEKSEIVNIIIDVSYNTGGNVGALLRVLGYLTDELIEYTSYNAYTENGSIHYYAVDTNDDDDYENDAYDMYNWFILSSGVSFSAANALVSIAKQMGIATIIGNTSGGGGSSIVPIVLADGATIILSSNNVMATASSDGSGGYIFTSIERGVEPDYYYPKSDYYNDAKLVEFIHSILN